MSDIFFEKIERAYDFHYEWEREQEFMLLVEKNYVCVL